MSLSKKSTVIVENLRKKQMREAISAGKRLDERSLDEIRPIEIELDVIKKANGSAWVKLGNTEVVAGVKAKGFNNVFVGFSLQLKRLVSNKEPDNFENLYIPGFNRTYDGDFGVGFNYTVTYFVPIYKKKVKPVVVSKKSDKKK